MVETRGLLARFWARLSRRGTTSRTPRDSPSGEHARTSETIEETPIDLETLLDEISDLIAGNQTNQIIIQGDIKKLEILIEDEIEDLKNVKKHDDCVFKRRMILRRINNKRKRLKRLEKIVVIYHDNIDLHYQLSGQLDEARISGLKKITEDQLNELTLDHQEQTREHKDVISTGKALLISSKASEPDLQTLADEFGIKLGDKDG